MKRFFISTLCVAMMLALSACESPEQRASNEISGQPEEDTAMAEYAKVLTHYDDQPSLISGEVSYYVLYSSGLAKVVFKEPFTVYIDGDSIATNTVRTHASNVYIFYND